MKFRKKIVVEAIQWNPKDPKLRDQSTGELFVDGLCYDDNENVVCETLEGDLHVSPGDWIITGIEGEHYPCKPNIFEATYEPAVS